MWDMARKETLTVKLVENLAPRAKAYRVSDGGGLLLAVYPGGSKAWLARTTVDGRRRDIGIGGFPAVSLAEARQKAKEACKVAREGRDPGAEKKAAKADRIAAQAKAQLAAQSAKERTFEAVAESYIKVQEPGWKHPKTAALWRQSLKDHASSLGPMPVNTITRDHVIDTIAPLWASRPATARKVLHRIGAVLAHAAFRGYRPNDNITSRRDLVRNGALPKPPGGEKQPSLPWQTASAFMAELSRRDGIAPLAFRFLILTCVRSVEARGARWSEIDFENAIWTVPGRRMKGEKSKVIENHRVPLPAQALEILRAAYSCHAGREVTLEELPRLAALKGSELIFATPRDLKKPLSDNAISKILREMNEGQNPPPWRDADGRQAVPHGFRASFRSWQDDCHPTERKAAEAALGHKETQQTVASYARSDVLNRRRPLMQAWADQCCNNSYASIIQLEKLVARQ